MSGRIVVLYNDCLSQEIFLTYWKIAEVSPIPEGPDKDPSDPKSYWPISLLPNTGKWLERLMVRRLENVTEPDNCR